MLNSQEIERVLLKSGFHRTLVNKRILGFLRDGSPHPVYVKTPSGNTTVDFVDKEPLVIHPRYMARREAISRISGLAPNWEKFFHNSNMRGFDKRHNGGQTAIEYGVALSVQDELALQKLVDGLNVDFSESKTYSEEIEEASSDLASVSTTTRKAIIDARVGQGQFRLDLIELWRECAVTGCKIITLLRASHIKPWRSSTNEERLDKFNGLLLNPLWDAALDNGLISFEGDGKVLISHAMGSELEGLGIHSGLRLKTVFPQSLAYLAWHREHVYKG